MVFEFDADNNEFVCIFRIFFTALPLTLYSPRILSSSDFCKKTGGEKLLKEQASQQKKSNVK